MCYYSDVMIDLKALYYYAGVADDEYIKIKRSNIMNSALNLRNGPGHLSEGGMRGGTISWHAMLVNPEDAKYVWERVGDID